MNTFVFFLIIYFGTTAGKFFFLFIRFNSEKKFRKKIIKLERKLIFLHIFIPFSSFFSDIKFFDLKKFKLVETFCIILFLLFSISLNKIYTLNNADSFEIILHFLIFLFSICSVLYLSIHDILYFSVPVRFTVRLLFFTVFIHIFVIFLKILDSIDSLIFENLGNLSNIGGFLLLYFLTYALIVFTKEKGIGMGDADINGYIGLMLGVVQGAVFIFITIFLGAIIGLGYSFIIKKFKGVLIPMVPIIALSYVISIGYSSDFLNFILII